jgi:hypothetical protein
MSRLARAIELVTAGSGDGVAFFLEHVRDHDRSTFLGEQPGFRRPHTVCATGNDRDLVFQSHVSLPVDEHDAFVGCDCETRR